MEKKKNSLFTKAKELVQQAISGSGNQPNPPVTEDFRWFKLITIPPDIEEITIENFNNQVANWLFDSLKNKDDISFIEMYLTREAMNRLVRDIKIDKNSEKLVEAVNQRISGASSSDNNSMRVSFSPKGLLITPALDYIFNSSFIARVIEKPQVYIPSDESKISDIADQFLIGALRVEDSRGSELGRTPIRAVVAKTESNARYLRLSSHVDFDILFKAFSDNQLCSYPLGINLSCLIEYDNRQRKVSQVSLDFQDTKRFATLSQDNPNAFLSYKLIEGGQKELDVLEAPDDYPVELFSIAEARDQIDYYDLVPGANIRRRVAGKVGLLVNLTFINDGRTDSRSFKFLFSFFEKALRFSAMSNTLRCTGQFVNATGETEVMLPPLWKDGRKISQSPAFIISSVTGKENAFNIRKHPDASLTLTIDGETVDTTPMEIDLSAKVEVNGASGSEGDSQTEDFKFTITPLNLLNSEQSKIVDARKTGLGREYSAFVEIGGTRYLSLAQNEVVLGRNRFLTADVDVNANALTVARRYVTWILVPSKEDEIFYYCMVRGKVVSQLSKVSSTTPLGLLGTYYVYLDDYEFMIFLESTPANEDDDS